MSNLISFNDGSIGLKTKRKTIWISTLDFKRVENKVNSHVQRSCKETGKNTFCWFLHCFNGCIRC